MATLSSSEQQLLTLSFIDDLSHQAIAEISGVPLGSIKSTIRRALLKIRKKLDPNTSCQPTETKMFYEVTADEKS
jgi:RNA polymerase sigma-70 factor (ECF subfamily)